ncbi:2778_t:CDS:1, partial [Paraglomus occultum]
VGYFKDVIDHTLKPTPRRRSPSQVVSPPQTDVISISVSKTTLTRERKGSIKGQRHITEDELGTPVNIYLEHRDHLEQDKKARVDLDTKLIKESLYVPNVSPDAVVSPTFKTPESSGPSTPTNTDWDFSIWLGDGMRKDCFYDWYGGMGTHGIMYTSFEGYHGLGI